MAEKAISKEDRLRKVPLFGQLSKKGLAHIVALADVVDVPAGEVIVKQGGYGDQFVLILEGQAKVERDGTLVNTLSEDDFFGEIALITNRLRVATVTALTPMKVLAVHKSHFDELLEQTPALWKEIAIALGHYIPGKE
jgi:CRP-like cAMP-binding protein